MVTASTEYATALRDGIAAGMGTAFVGFIGGLVAGIRRSRDRVASTTKEMADMAAQIEELQRQHLKAREFQRMQIQSQMAIMSTLRTILAISSRSCADCPQATEMDEDVRKANSSMDEFSKSLNDYLQSLL